MATWQEELDVGMLRLLVEEATGEASRQGKDFPLAELEDKLISALTTAEASGYVLTDLELAAVLYTYVCNREMCPEMGSSGIHG